MEISDRYSETVDWLYNQLPMFSVVGAGAYKPGLQTAHILDDAWDNPHKSYRTIHVAGTNGKGSTSHMLASVLMAAGYKVGLYTSPHIFDFRERIRVDGVKISRESVVEFVEKYKSLSLEVAPSFFELTTIMAFNYFRQQKVDIAVIETGLGGRLDTTNIITPELSVITNVSLDHTAQLGDNVVDIAGEKAGIIKGGVPVVIGHATGDVRKVFEDKAAEQNAPIIFAEDSYRYFDGCDLKGEFQIQNINTVLHALDVLGVTDKKVIKIGLENVCARTGLIGRWTILRKNNPTIIFDTGHNIGAWEYLAPQLAEIARSQRLHIVLGFVEDKDIEPIFAMLPNDTTYYFVAPDTKRARSAQSLKTLADRYNLIGESYPDASSGYQAALNSASGTDVLFIGGSNYLIASITQIREELQ